MNHTIDLNVLPGGDVQVSFTQLKALQTLGMTDERSNIKFNGITLPAGAFSSFDDYFKVYCALASKELGDLESLIPNDLSQTGLHAVMYAISRESQILGMPGLTPEEMDEIADKKLQPVESAKQM